LRARGDKNMQLTNSYLDLCNEIEAWKARIKSYESQREALWRLAKLDGPTDISAVDYSRSPVQNTCQVGMLEAIEMIRKIDSHILIHQEAITNMEKQRDEMESLMLSTESLDKKIVYLRDIKNMKLTEIAKQLGYSYDHIRRVNSRNKSLKNATKNATAI
jgi:DNA-directed RNA polymerase specialized sigma24 family protein